ncbi:hypothetical protein SAMN04489761_1601 [Tenacibaculum sp. MAR_2009_124]|uniref:tetratricopeptide repeat protein n=1 Tax=Tenacibaculum sp. MAR_2009_124 TaxID=1250059 RepID=UPI0008978BE4|nr:tetratricopeptide repeat protein [Tenacibaculum sp. MAR_2009_124]SEB73337.1 hypothetical protein SAMN04489761_1601 [Tenacibaculum sp. MAR_2009_124]
MSLEEDILIERYLKNELDNKERTVFEERLRTDGEFNEKVNFEKELFNTFNENEWSFHHNNEEDLKDLESYFEKEEVKELQQNIKSSFESIKKKKPTKVRKLYFISIAASITVLLGLFLLKPFNTKLNSNALFEYYLPTEELPTFVNRGDNDLEDLVRGENFYRSKNYKRASDTFNTILEKKDASVGAYIYAGLSYAQLGEYEKSEKIFDRLIQSDLIDAEKGYWYKSLVNLKSNNIEKAKEDLRYIITNSLYHKKEAQELLKKLD